MNKQPFSSTWILIGNYAPDKQESMLRFTKLLVRGLHDFGVKVKVIKPFVFFGYMVKDTRFGFGKWMGYLDKWLLFQFYLLIIRFFNTCFERSSVYHICDHSNSPYMWLLPKKRTSLTCHDVLAIQAALGDASTYCHFGIMGKLLQRYILSGLKVCPNIVTVSEYTLNNLRLLEGKRPKYFQRCIIPNALNDGFSLLDKELIADFSSTPPVPSNPYLFHVGSSLARKNRKALLYMAAALGDRWHGDIVYAGEPVESELWQIAKSLSLEDRIHSIEKPSHEHLNLLYNRCAAFVFPSYSEGFGWPLIEAQTCGAPIITNDIPVLREVSGGAAIYVAVDDAYAMADAFLLLQNCKFRDVLIKQGFENCQRFTLSLMAQSYISIHPSTISKSAYVHHVS